MLEAGPIGIGTLSTLAGGGGARNFLPEIMYEKMNKISEFYMIFARKINKIP